MKTVNPDHHYLPNNGTNYYYIGSSKNKALQKALLANFPIAKENYNLGICTLIGTFNPSRFQATDQITLDDKYNGRYIKVFHITTK